MAEVNDEKAVRMLLRDWAEAHVRRDIAAFERLYADDFVYTDFTGTVWDKAKYIASVTPDFTCEFSLNYETPCDCHSRGDGNPCFLLKCAVLDPRVKPEDDTWREFRNSKEFWNSDETSVRIYGDTAVLTSRETMKGVDQGFDYTGQYRITLLFGKRQRRWQMIAGQGTRIAQQ